MKLTIEVPEGYMVRVVPEEKDSRTVTQEWMAENKDKWPNVTLERELEKAKAWCSTNKRQCTRRFFTNWLNRIDPDFYKQTAQADLLAEADQIKAKGYTDALGIWKPMTEQDGQRLKELRQLYKQL